MEMWQNKFLDFSEQQKPSWRRAKEMADNEGVLYPLDEDPFFENETYARSFLNNSVAKFDMNGIDYSWFINDFTPEALLCVLRFRMMQLHPATNLGFNYEDKPNSQTLMLMLFIIDRKLPIFAGMTIAPKNEEIIAENDLDERVTKTIYENLFDEGKKKQQKLISPGEQFRNLQTLDKLVVMKYLPGMRNHDALIKTKLENKLFFFSFAHRIGIFSDLRKFINIKMPITFPEFQNVPGKVISPIGFLNYTTEGISYINFSIKNIKLFYDTHEYNGVFERAYTTSFLLLKEDQTKQNELKKKFDDESK